MENVKLGIRPNITCFQKGSGLADMSLDWKGQVGLSSYISESKQQEDWRLATSKTRYATHGMHTWPAAMIPALAQKLIRKTGAKSVLDPFCGGGTVCVESILNRLPTAGVDINPLAIIVTKAKTTFCQKKELSKWLEWIFRKTRECKGSEPENLERERDFRINYWFKPYMLRSLRALSSAVMQIDDEKARTFFQCVLSATARGVSLTHRNEMRLRLLEPKERSNFNPDVMRQFTKRAIDSMNRVQTIPHDSIANIEQGDARQLPFEDDSFTTTICSPPYGDERNGVPYFQFARNMLCWLGFDRKELLKLKSRTLGSLGKRTDFQLSQSPSVQEYSINMPKEKSKLLTFYSDYFEALKEITRVTSDKVAIVIGNRVLQKLVIDNAKITNELFNSIGCTLESHYVRQLPSKRLPRLTDYGGGGIDREHILVYDVTSKSFVTDDDAKVFN